MVVLSCRPDERDQVSKAVYEWQRFGRALGHRRLAQASVYSSKYEMFAAVVL